MRKMTGVVIERESRRSLHLLLPIANQTAGIIGNFLLVYRAMGTARMTATAQDETIKNCLQSHWAPLAGTSTRTKASTNVFIDSNGKFSG